jgi:hypothetical protein
LRFADPAEVSEAASELDVLVAWGSPENIAARVREHRDAGANHVCVQVLGDPSYLRAEWRALAPALTAV